MGRCNPHALRMLTFIQRSASHSHLLAFPGFPLQVASAEDKRACSTMVGPSLYLTYLLVQAHTVCGSAPSFRLPRLPEGCHHSILQATWSYRACIGAAAECVSSRIVRTTTPDARSFFGVKEDENNLVRQLCVLFQPVLQQVDKKASYSVKNPPCSNVTQTGNWAQVRGHSRVDGASIHLGFRALVHNEYSQDATWATECS